MPVRNRTNGVNAVAASAGFPVADIFLAPDGSALLPRFESAPAAPNLRSRQFPVVIAGNLLLSGAVELGFDTDK